jgi:hypothetical protein
MDHRRVTEIFASNTSSTSCGSGYLIAPQFVLTARHVIEPALAAGLCEVRFLGDFEQGRTGWQVFEPFWDDAGLDIAVLRQSATAAGYAAGPTTPARLVRVHRKSELMPCSAVGYPRVLRHGDRNDTTQVSGKINPFDRLMDRQWQITVTDSAMPTDDLAWKGVSGAAVFCAGRLVGVITQTQTCFRNSVLVAQPIEAVFELAGWHEKLCECYPDGYETFGAGHDPGPWERLYALAYLIDRETPMNQLTLALGKTAGSPQAPRILVCGVPGAPEHEHMDLIERLRLETVPGLPGRPGLDRIEPIEWPEKADSVPRGLQVLRANLHSVLGIADIDAASSPARIATALNGNVKPRVFYSEIRASWFVGMQRDLVLAWMDEWRRISDAGLNDLVTLFLCLILDEVPAPKPLPWWKRRNPSSMHTSLTQFARDHFGPDRPEDLVRDNDRLRLLLMSDLTNVRRPGHLREWKKKLEALEDERWVAGHVTTLLMALKEDSFPLRTVLDTLEKLKSRSIAEVDP